MNHPLTFIPSPNRKPAFFVFLAGTLILLTVFRVLDSHIPGGIVSFEFAGSPSNAQFMIYMWNERARLFVAFSLGFDYLFMPVYALALSLGILLAASRHPGAFAKVGAWLGWGALIAPLFDAVENYGLLRSLFNPLYSLWPLVSFVCATVKFTLLLVGLAYALIGWLWRGSVNTTKVHT
jgi:hypothetical protein